MSIFKGDSIYKSGGGGGGYKDGGQLVDGNFIKVENNTVSSLDNVSRDPINLYFEPKDGEILNSVVELTTSVSATVNVYVVKNGFYYLLGNVGGDSVTAGNDYKVNITGDSYSIETVSGGSSDPEYATIRGQVIPVKKIGSLLWTRENLDMAWPSLPIGSSYYEFGGTFAMYYNNDEATAKARKYGLLYSYGAADWLNNNINEFIGDGWRLPKRSEYQYLIDQGMTAPNIKASNLSYAPSWGGNDSSKLSFVPAGFHNGSAFYEQITRTDVWCSDGDKYRMELKQNENTIGLGSGTKAFSFSIRIVKDV